jgi:hypothetical protein
VAVSLGVWAQKKLIKLTVCAPGNWISLLSKLRGGNDGIVAE